MKRTLEALNRMVDDGVIDGYVIGGAIAAAYYVEPVSTHDLDVFFRVAVSEDGLISLSPLYSYLHTRGYEPEGAGVNIEGWSVQFLPIFNALYQDAYDRAPQVAFEGVPVKVMTPEHLVAVMLQTGRPKDLVRIIQFLEAKAVDRRSLTRVVARHGLTQQWKEFLRRHQLRSRLRTPSVRRIRKR